MPTLDAPLRWRWTQGMGTWAAFRAAAAEKLGCAPGSHMDYIWEGCSIDEPDGRLLADILRDGDTVMLVCMSGACALSSIAAAEGSDSQPARPPTKRSPLVRMPAAAAAPCSESSLEPYMQQYIASLLQLNVVQLQVQRVFSFTPLIIYCEPPSESKNKNDHVCKRTE